MADEELTVQDPEAVGTKEEELTEEQKVMARLKEAITVQRESIGSLREKLTITVPRDVLDERLGEQLAELKRDAMVPGFRKGHAPLRLVEKRFSSDVGDQLKTQMVSSGYLAAVEKEELKPLGDPLIWVKVDEERTDDAGRPRRVEVEKLLSLDRALDEIDFPKEGELTFSCEVELKPEFELPELDKIQVERPKVAIADEDVDAEVDRMRRWSGTYRPAEGTAIEADDLLYADIRMSVGDEVLMYEKHQELAARDLRIKGVPVVGLGKALIGKKPGASLSVEAEIPADHENLDIRGKRAKFEFTVHEVKRLELPELTDEFASVIGYDSVDDLRAVVRANLESRLDQVMKRKMKDQVAGFLVANTKLEIPEGLSQRQTDRSVARRMIELYQSGMPEAEIRKQVDEMRVKAHDQTVHDLKLYFILEKIAEQRDVDVTEEQINTAIAGIAQRTNRRFDRVRDELSKGDGIMTLYLTIRDDLVLDLLAREAEVVEVEGPKKKVPKKTAAAKPPAGPAARKAEKETKADPKPKAEKKGGAGKSAKKSK